MLFMFPATSVQRTQNANIKKTQNLPKYEEAYCFHRYIFACLKFSFLERKYGRQLEATFIPKHVYTRQHLDILSN